MARPRVEADEMRAKGFVDPEEAAAIAGVARSTVYGWIYRELIKKRDVVVLKHRMGQKVSLGVWIRRSGLPTKEDARRGIVARRPLLRDVRELVDFVCGVMRDLSAGRLSYSDAVVAVLDAAEKYR